MNKYFTYENYELWDNKYWEDRISRVNGLVQWIQREGEMNTDDYPHPPYEDKTKIEHYKQKTRSVDDPEVIGYWAKRGLRMSVLSMPKDKRWVSMVPEKAFLDRERKIPALIVLHKEDYESPYWAMRTVAHYHALNEMAAESGDFMIIYLVNPKPDKDRIYLNILQEAFCLYPADLSRLYLDVTLPISRGQKLGEIPEFYYTDDTGNPADPDEAVESFGKLKIPVINIGGRWGNRDSLSRGLVMNYEMNEGFFDRPRVLHSIAGKRLMDGIVLEHRFDSLESHGVREHFDSMGLRLDIHQYKGERWTSLVPKCCFDEPENKLPMMLVVQEVYPGNEHLALTAKTYFYATCEIAAQGECILVFFALEDLDSNDMLADIAEEAAKLYPVDMSRVYITGHSHDGQFSREFARRHPRLIAAVATLGNTVGFMAPEELGNPVFSVSEEQIESMRAMDMPTINLYGTGEPGGKVPIHGAKSDGEVASIESDFTKWAEHWRRRLRAYNCPDRTVEQILDASVNGRDKATRVIGVPNDKSVTLWADGFEHYMVYINNNEGKEHLCMAASENMPHTTTPFMLEMAWGFLKRFARDRETGETIELY